MRNAGEGRGRGRWICAALAGGILASAILAGCKEPENGAPAPEANAKPGAQESAAAPGPAEFLDALERCLETHLALKGAPPRDWSAFVKFYEDEMRLAGPEWRLNSREWKYSSSLEKDAATDPTDPEAKGFRWRFLDPDPSWTQKNPWRLSPREIPAPRWTAAPAGLVIRLDHLKDSSARLVKWLPIEEQLRLAEGKAPAALLERLLRGWMESMPAGGCDSEFFAQIAPALRKAVSNENEAVRLAALRCVEEAVKRTAWPAPDSETETEKTGRDEALAILREALLSPGAPTRKRAALATYFLPRENWNALVNAWAAEPDPMARVAAAQVARGRSREGGARFLGWYYPTPELFHALRADDDPRARFEFFAMAGRETVVLAGSMGRDYLREHENFQQFAAEVLTSGALEDRRAFLEGLGDSGEVTYAFSVGGSEAEIEDFRNALFAQIEDPDPEIRLLAARVLLEARVWPRDFADLAPFLERRDAQTLSLLGAAFPRLEMAGIDGIKPPERKAPPPGMPKESAREYSMRLLREADEATLIRLVGLDESSGGNWAFYGFPSIPELAELLPRFAKAKDPRLRRFAAMRAPVLFARPGEVPETLRKPVEAMKRALLKDPDLETRLSAAQGFLAWTASKDGGAALAEWLRAQKDPLRAQAALRFSYVKNPVLLGELERVAREGPAHMRWDATVLLREREGGAYAEFYKRNVSAAPPRYQVMKSMEDFRALTVAISAYNVDWGMGLDQLRRLTTPVAYMTALPADPFRPAESPDYAWISLFDGRNLPGALQGFGPDGRDDFSSRIGAVRDRVATPSSLPPASTIYLPVVYDPSNGILSPGDYLFPSYF